MATPSETRNIPFFNYPDQYERYGKELLQVIEGVCKRGAYILQSDVTDFEQNLIKFLGIKHAFGVADGSNALSLALIAAGIGKGDEVIVPSHTYIATAAAVHFTGAQPVLVDCGRDHLVDPASVKAAVTSKTKAIMPVQLNGRTADMDSLSKIAKEHGLHIIEDAAQALGSKFKNRSAGTFGLAGTISFYPAKILGCFGDGGAVVTNDDALAAKLFMLRDHGRDPEGMVRCWGFNSRLDNLQAAILNFKFKFLESEIARRRELAGIYQTKLGSLSQLLLPPSPESDVNHYDVYQNYEIEADDRDGLRRHLQERGVRTIIQWGGSAVHQFEALGFKEKPPYTEAMFKRCLLLPMNTALSNEDVSFVCDQVIHFYKS